MITLEDGILEGGYGQKIASYYGPSKVMVKTMVLKRAFQTDTILKNYLRKWYFSRTDCKGYRGAYKIA